MMRRPFSIKQPGADYEIRVVGARPAPLRDFYHALLRASWWATIAVISVAYLAANVLFALAYVTTDGLEHAAPGSFRDAFFFSVQTMGTIGYGAMFPRSVGANLVVVVESIVSLLLTALSTGLVFAKFSRSRGRFSFTRQAVISPVDGTPTLTVRVGNERGNQIVDAQIRDHAGPHGANRRRAHLLPCARSAPHARSRAGAVALVEHPSSHRRFEPAARRDARLHGARRKWRCR